jgi:hypothetical protein
VRSYDDGLVGDDIVQIAGSAGVARAAQDSAPAADAALRSIASSRVAFDAAPALDVALLAIPYRDVRIDLGDAVGHWRFGSARQRWAIDDETTSHWRIGKASNA